MDQNGSKWIKMNQNELKWIEVNWSELKWIEMNQNESKWIKMNQTESNWIKLNQNESKWIKIDWNELASHWNGWHAVEIETYHQQTPWHILFPQVCTILFFISIIQHLACNEPKRQYVPRKNCQKSLDGAETCPHLFFMARHKITILLIGLLLFFHCSMTESSYQTWYVIFLHNGSERGRSEVATAAIMHHFAVTWWNNRCQDIIPGIIYTVSSVMRDTLFPLFSLG
jgi:hypothetical protein